MEKIILTNGSRIAEINETLHGTYDVYVGFKGDVNCPGEETIPARFFNGTCSKSYKTKNGAEKAVDKFLNE